MPSQVEGMAIGIFVPIYRACAQLGMSAPIVDEMEVWEVASVLGVDMGDTSTPATGGPPPPGALSRGRARRRKAAG